MVLSATRRKGHPDPDLLAVQSPEHALVSNKEEGPDPDLHPVQNPEHALVSNKQEGPDPDLHPVQNPEHALVSNKQEGPARACSCQQQAGNASHILTYILFKTQSMFLSATRRKGQPDPDLHSVKNPEHVLVSNKEERPARS